jgi:hypothetical protein
VGDLPLGSESGNPRINPLTLELNPSAQRCLPRFFTGILIFKGLTARRLYKSFDVKGLNIRTSLLNPSAQRCLPRFFTGILILKGSLRDVFKVVRR